MFIESWKRVSDKIDDFGNLFGYLLVDPIVPDAMLYGPQEESDEFEAKLDKCIADRVDYFAEEYGYDSEEERKQVAAMTEYFV